MAEDRADVRDVDPRAEGVERVDKRVDRPGTGVDRVLAGRHGCGTNPCDRGSGVIGKARDQLKRADDRRAPVARQVAEDVEGVFPAAEIQARAAADSLPAPESIPTQTAIFERGVAPHRLLAIAAGLF